MVVHRSKNEESWIIDNIKGDDFWRIENYQRNYLQNGLFDADGEDIIIISDLDEIPNLQNLDKLISNKFKYTGFKQKMI